MIRHSAHLHNVVLFTVIYFMRYQVLEFVNNLTFAIGNSRMSWWIPNAVFITTANIRGGYIWIFVFHIRK